MLNTRCAFLCSGSGGGGRGGRRGRGSAPVSLLPGPGIQFNLALNLRGDKCCGVTRQNFGSRNRISLNGILTDLSIACKITFYIYESNILYSHSVHLYRVRPIRNQRKGIKGENVVRIPRPLITPLPSQRGHTTCKFSRARASVSQPRQRHQ